MDSFINTFHIDWKIIIAQAINFTVVLFILQYLALKPIKKIMKERSDRIKEGLNDAEKNAEILKNSKKEYDTIITNARKEANEIFQNGKKEAEEKKNEMIAKAGKDVETMIQNGKSTLESEKNKMIEEAKSEIVSLVVLATEKLLNNQDNEPFNKSALEEIKKL